MSCWVLLRGLMRERRHWGDFPALLAEALAEESADALAEGLTDGLAEGLAKSLIETPPEAVIITPDLPGNGEHHSLRSATTVARMVEFCRQDLRERGLKPPYSLLALSLGGMVAVEWASRYPDEITRCVLINTSMRPHGRFYQRLRWQNYAAIGKLVLLGGVERQERLILRLTSRNGGAGARADGVVSAGGKAGDDRGVSASRNSAVDGRAVDAGLLSRWLDYQSEFPVTRANALRQLWSAARFRAPPARPPPPLLILSSAGDRLVDHRCSLRLAQAWNVECILHPDAGHDLPLDDGPWVARSVAKWLAAEEHA